MRSGGTAGFLLALLPLAACGFQVSAAGDGGVDPRPDEAVDGPLVDDADPDGPVVTDMGALCPNGRRWAADFSVDPRTLDSDGDGMKDWRRRNQPGDQPLGGQLDGGTWSVGPQTAILDTQPDINWQGTTTATIRMRASSVSPDIEDPMGVVAWFNVGYDGPDYGVIIVSVTRDGDDDQNVQLYTKTSNGAPRIPIDDPVELDDELADIDLRIDQVQHTVRMTVNGTTRQGSFTEFMHMGNMDKWATLYAWDTEGEFDAVEITSCP